MKKLYYPLFALATMAMTTSCSDELDNGAASNSNEATVSFNLQLENAVGSRAIGDGTTAKELHYAVYKVDRPAEGAAMTIGTEIKALRCEGTTTITDKEAQVNFTLVKGQTYNFLFWAQCEEGSKYYTIDYPAGTIEVKYNDIDEATEGIQAGIEANDENRDAFFKMHKDVLVNGPIEETITLKRPFAQVNVGTEIGSLADAATAEVWIKESKLVIDNVATKLDTYTGAVLGEPVKVTYTKTAIPESKADDKVGDLKDVEGKNYEYLAMNYILVNDKNSTDGNNADGSRQDQVNAWLEIWGSQTKDGATELINEFTIPNVPVQRNWRTNIIGDILNETVTFNIVIDAEFNKNENGEDINYFTEKELAYAFATGGEINLSEDITLTEPLILTDKVVTINLNGKTIKGGLFKEADGAISEGATDSYPFWVQGGTLNIKGEGKIEAQACKYTMAVFASGGTVNIYGGEYKNGEGGDLIYAKNDAQINIYGGKFIAGYNSAKDEGTQNDYSALNLKDDSQASIKVYGGEFYKFNPAYNVSENPQKDFVADGYGVKQDGDYFVVVPWVEVLNFTAETPAVTLLSNLVADETINVAAGQTLNGAGYTLQMEKSTAQYALQMAGGTISDLTINGYNDRNEDSKVTRGIYIVNPTESVTIKNVKIDDVAYTLNTGTNSSVADLKLTVENSDLIGWSSWDGGFASASFEGCYFGIGDYFKNAEEVAQGWNGAIRPYVATTFKNCVFDRNFCFMLDKLPEGAKITLINCSLKEGVIIEANNLGKAISIADEDHSKVTFE